MICVFYRRNIHLWTFFMEQNARACNYIFMCKKIKMLCGSFFLYIFFIYFCMMKNNLFFFLYELAYLLSWYSIVVFCKCFLSFHFFYVFLRMLQCWLLQFFLVFFSFFFTEITDTGPHTVLLESFSTHTIYFLFVCFNASFSI